LEAVVVTFRATSRLGLAWVFLCGLLCAVPGCETEREKREREQERLEAKRLDDFYEGEWVKCVNELGMERCRIIQETGFQQCENKRTVNGTANHNSCVEDRLKDRLKAITPLEAEEAEKDPDNPRAAPPVANAPLPEAPEENKKTEAF
jgi:hypothetical protein